MAYSLRMQQDHVVWKVSWQEPEASSARKKRGVDICVQGMELPVFKMDLSTSVNLINRILGKHAQRLNNALQMCPGRLYHR